MGSVNKAILVGNLGRDALHDHTRVHHADPDALAQQAGLLLDMSR